MRVFNVWKECLRQREHSCAQACCSMYHTSNESGFACPQRHLATQVTGMSPISIGLLDSASNWRPATMRVMSTPRFSTSCRGRVKAGGTQGGQVMQLTSCGKSSSLSVHTSSCFWHVDWKYTCVGGARGASSEGQGEAHCQGVTHHQPDARAGGEDGDEGVAAINLLANTLDQLLALRGGCGGRGAGPHGRVTRSFKHTFKPHATHSRGR